MHALPRTALAAAALAGLAAHAGAVTLYDAAAGTLPAAQGWFTSAGGGASGTESIDGGVLAFGSTGAGVVAYGNVRLSPVVLDAAAGYAVDFSLQVLNEAHTGSNRAGFALLLVGNDPRQAVELSFWADRVWVPDYVAADPDRFVQGAGAAFDTTAALTNYRLAVQGTGYTLSADGRALFSGALNDYTPQGQPYTVANLVFFGDDSSRGAASVRLGSIAVSPVPEPATAALLLAGVAVVGAAAARRGRRG